MKIEFIEIIKSSIEQNKNKTYDIEVENAHSYNIEGIIVHNSACKTRLQTGCGRPQVSTIIECADAAHGVGGMIMSDGGIVVNGDICKAFCLNSDFVMCGSMFAKCEESDGETYIEYEELTPMYKENCGEMEIIGFKTDKNEFVGFDKNIKKINNRHFLTKKYKLFYGMSSKIAQDKFMGGMKCYRASEGRELLIECCGSLQSIINDINGSLRSCGTYIGAKTLKEFGKRSSFYRVSGKQQLNLSLVK